VGAAKARLRRLAHSKNRNGIAQRYFCKIRGKYFCESPSLDGIRIERPKVVQIVKLLAEGLGVRSTARICGVDPHTILSGLRSVTTVFPQVVPKEQKLPNSRFATSFPAVEVL